MMSDPIVEEVRNIREEYARRFNFDLQAISKDLQEKERAHGRVVVSFPPRRPNTSLVPATKEPAPSVEVGCE